MDIGGTLSFIADFHCQVLSPFENYPALEQGWLCGGFVCWVGQFGSSGLEFGLKFEPLT